MISLSLLEQPQPDLPTLTETLYDYERVGYDCRPMSFLPDGTVGAGAAGREIFWQVHQEHDESVLEISSKTELTVRLRQDENGVWHGQWLHGEKMPIRLTPRERPNSLDGVSFIECAAPHSGRRRAFVAALSALHHLSFHDQATANPPVIVEIGAIRNKEQDARETDGWSTCTFGWYAQHFGAEFHTVDNSAEALQISRSATQKYTDCICYHQAEGAEFLRTFERPISLLFLDTGHSMSDLGQGRHREIYRSLPVKPLLLLFDDVFEDESISSGLYVIPDAVADGYEPLFFQDTQLCLVHVPSLNEAGLAYRKKAWSTPVTGYHLTRSGRRSLCTRTLEVRVFSDGQGDFARVTDANVLIYFPHGFGDWVQLAYVLPLLNPSNRYWIARYGDHTTALMDGNPYVTPLYLGVNSAVNVGDGAFYNNEHFGIPGDGNGTARAVQFPLSIYDACRHHNIDTVFRAHYYEAYGNAAYPFHTKARNFLSGLVDTRLLDPSVLAHPLKSSINFEVPAWVTQYVESCLKNYLGFGERKLCLIARNGYTSIGKNWAHMFREDMPEGKQQEGEECRDFMRLLLQKDPHWAFLIMEDTLFAGEDTVRSEELHAFSYAELFGKEGQSFLPFGLVMKALVNLADLSVGVPTGPYHLSMAKPELPTVGLWIEHLPSWYDEPKEASRHIVSSHARDLFLRPGSFSRHEDLAFATTRVPTRVITGEQVLTAVEELIY